MDLVTVRPFLLGAALLLILEFDEVGVVGHGLVGVDDAAEGNEGEKNDNAYTRDGISTRAGKKRSTASIKHVVTDTRQ